MRDNNNDLQFALISVALKSLGKMLVDVAEQLMIYNRKEFRIDKDNISAEDIENIKNVEKPLDIAGKEYNNYTIE